MLEVVVFEGGRSGWMKRRFLARGNYDSQESLTSWLTLGGLMSPRVPDIFADNYGERR